MSRDDLRTLYGRETEVIKQVAADKGFSIFWATEFQTRACAVDRLIERGAIVRVDGGAFPWCPYRIKEKGERHVTLGRRGIA